MATATELSENSRQGFEVQNAVCIGLEVWLSQNTPWGCGHVYDETPVGIAVYVRNDPVNLVDKDGQSWVNWGDDWYSGPGVDPDPCEWGGELFAPGFGCVGLAVPIPLAIIIPPLPQCFAQLKYRNVNDWRARLADATHSFWWVQDSTGTQWIISGGPDKSNDLNVWVTQGNDNHSGDNSSQATAWSSGLSTANCAGVSAMLAAANSFPNGKIRYSAFGPNSNSAAHYIGTKGGFNPSPPPGAVGWSTPIVVPSEKKKEVIINVPGAL
jgi:hypothetical protein